MVWSLAMDDFSGMICRENVTYPLLKAINLALGFNVSQMDSAGVQEIVSIVKKQKVESISRSKLPGNVRMDSRGESSGAGVSAGQCRSQEGGGQL